MIFRNFTSFPHIKKYIFIKNQPRASNIFSNFMFLLLLPFLRKNLKEKGEIILFIDVSMRLSKLLSSNSLIKVISILNDAAAAAFSQQFPTMKLLLALIKKIEIKRTYKTLAKKQD